MPMSAKILTVTQRVLMPARFGRLGIAADGKDIAAKAGACCQETSWRHADRDQNQNRNGKAMADENLADRGLDIIGFDILLHDAFGPRDRS